MSGVTDNLIKLARQLAPDPTERELDVLLATGEQTTIALTAMTPQRHGRKGGFAHGRAGRNSDRRAPHQGKNCQYLSRQIRRYLADGVHLHRRRVSDRHFKDKSPRSAAAVISLPLPSPPLSKTDREIYTDVDGVYSCDPRIVPSARKIDVITYDELLEMAASGSKVMQSRSVEFAKNSRSPSRSAAALTRTEEP